jgi:hypothetical protein
LQSVVNQPLKDCFVTAFLAMTVRLEDCFGAALLYALRVSQ